MDVTEHRTGTGKIDLAVVLDAWSRRVVGWSIVHHMRAELFADAVQMATWRRRPPAGQTITHCDQGANWPSWLFGNRVRSAGLFGSMGSIGECFDNSVAEAFFSKLQRELLDQHRWDTKEQLAAATQLQQRAQHHRLRNRQRGINAHTDPVRQTEVPSIESIANHQDDCRIFGRHIGFMPASSGHGCRGATFCRMYCDDVAMYASMAESALNGAAAAGEFGSLAAATPICFAVASVSKGEGPVSIGSQVMHTAMQCVDIDQYCENAGIGSALNGGSRVLLGGVDTFTGGEVRYFVRFIGSWFSIFGGFMTLAAFDTSERPRKDPA